MSFHCLVQHAGSRYPQTQVSGSTFRSALGHYQPLSIQLGERLVLAKNSRSVIRIIHLHEAEQCHRIKKTIKIAIVPMIEG